MSPEDTIELDPYLYGGEVTELPTADRYALYALMGVLSYVTGHAVGTVTDSLVVGALVVAVTVVATARVGYAAWRVANEPPTG